MNSKLFKYLLITVIGLIVFNQLSGGVFFRGINKGLKERGYIQQESETKTNYERSSLRIDKSKPLNIALIAGILFGGVVAAVSMIWLYVLEFFESIPWFVGSIIFPPALLIFGFQNFERANKPLLLMIGGMSLSVLLSVILYTTNV